MTLRYSAVLLVLALAGAGCRQSVSPDAPASSPTSSTLSYKRAIPSEYVVILNDDVAASRVPDVAADMALAHSAALEHTYRYAVKGFSATMTAQDADKLSHDARVKYIEPNYEIVLPDEVDAAGRPSGGSGGGSHGGSTTVSQIMPWGITRVGGSHDGTGKTAWVIDTGIDLTNADLNVDVNRSQNFVTKGKNSPKDLNGHGTHVAGTIGARNNTIDAIGVAANATLVAVRVLDANASGTTAWLIAGVDYVAANGHAGDVANISAAGPASQAVDDAVRNAAAHGILFSIAAGNNAASALNYSPARLDAPGVYTVSAVAPGDTLASFSNFGNPPIDYAAPGVSIASNQIGGGVVMMSGTSMAAPHVAGLLLLGSLRSNGSAISDPDGAPDPIAHY